LVVNRAETVKGKTLQDWLENRYSFPSPSETPFAKRSGIVHRLDKDTSGVIVVARKQSVFKNLQQQFKKRQVRKIYLVLVHGQIEPKNGDVKMPLGRRPTNRKKFTVRLRGKMAVTNYQRLAVYSKNKEKLSFLEVKPKTGRTHQIRVHFRHLGHPLVADPIYLGRKRLARDQLWCPRLFLHACQLEFIEPVMGKKRLMFQSKLPDDLKKVIQKLDQEDNGSF